MTTDNADLPLVSVLCATYQYGNYLPDAIESVLSQSYDNVEMVIVDDGSTDNTADVLERYSGKVVSTSTANRGQNAAFNTAFSMSTGSIVCLLDADDAMTENKVAEVVAAFGRKPEAGWLFHHLRYVALPSKDEIPDPVTARAPLPTTGDYDMRATMRAGRVPIVAPAASGLVFRRSLLERIFPLPELAAFGDHFLKFTAMSATCGIVLSDRLTDQGVHDRNAYTNRSDIGLFRARRMVNVGREMLRWDPELALFTDRLFAQALMASGFGRRLDAPEQTSVRAWCRGLSPRRGARVVGLMLSQISRRVWNRARRSLPW